MCNLTTINGHWGFISFLLFQIPYICSSSYLYEPFGERIFVLSHCVYIPKSGVEILVVFILSFVDNSQQFPEMIISFSLPTSSVYDHSSYSAFSPTLGVVLSFSS